MEEQLTPREMELELMNIGWQEDYLENLSSSAIERLYKSEILGEEEE